MTFQEALAVLGIDRGESPEKVRRAYLRHLREHSPERDPEGFRRLRDAYELLHMHARFGWGTEDEDRNLDGPPAERDPTEEAPEPCDSSSTGAPQEPWEMAEAGPDLFRGSRDWRELIGNLEEDAAATNPEPALLFRALATLLKLLQDGETDAATALGKAIASSIANADGRPAAIPSFLLARWLLARDLVLAAPGLPRQVLEPLARALAKGEPEAAAEAMRSFRREDPERAAAAAALLEASSRALWQAAAHELTVQQQPPVQRAQGNPLVNAIVLLASIAAAMGLLRTCIGPGGGSMPPEMADRLREGRRPATKPMDSWLFESLATSLGRHANAAGARGVQASLEATTKAIANGASCETFWYSIVKLREAVDAARLPPEAHADLRNLEDVGGRLCRAWHRPP